MLKSEVRHKPWLLTISLQKCFLHCETSSALMSWQNLLPWNFWDQINSEGTVSSQWHRGGILRPGKGNGRPRERDGCDSLGRERP